MLKRIAVLFLSVLSFQARAEAPAFDCYLYTAEEGHMGYDLDGSVQRRPAERLKLHQPWRQEIDGYTAQIHLSQLVSVGVSGRPGEALKMYVMQLLVAKGQFKSQTNASFVHGQPYAGRVQLSLSEGKKRARIHCVLARD